MKKKLMLLGMILLLFAAVPVFAKGLFVDDKVSPDERIEETSFVAGNTINMSSEVDGLNFVAGNNINLSSSQDHLFVAGNSLNLENVNTKDAFLAGSNITIKSSNIRDLYAAAQTIRVDSNISRNAYLGGDTVIINGTIEGNVKISAENIQIGAEAVINGTLKYPEKASITVADTAIVNETKTYATKEVTKTEKTFASKVSDAFTSFLSLLVIALLLLLTNKKFFKQIQKEDKEVAYFFKTAFIGFGFLVLTPIAAIIGLMTIIGIPLTIIGLLLYGILIYLSMIPTAYYLGNWILNKNIKNEYLLLTVSLAAIYILKYLPIIGGLVSFISLVLGLGIFVNMAKNSYEENKKK